MVLVCDKQILRYLPRITKSLGQLASWPAGGSRSYYHSHMLAPPAAELVYHAHVTASLLLCYCLAIASLLPRYCLVTTASSLPRYCLAIASLLPRYCLVIAPLLPRYCLVTASLLPPRCLAIAPSLLRCGLATASPLCLYCMGTLSNPGVPSTRLIASTPAAPMPGNCDIGLAGDDWPARRIFGGPWSRREPVGALGAPWGASQGALGSP